ncbi:hypothetical protein BASA81_005899 [Batrachochytrium salamandrivorans]|nr:hypothetical protein BASA81_005899 [Batrachochytrium salamandrivorans]
MRLFLRSKSYEAALKLPVEDRKNLVPWLSFKEGVKAAAMLSVFWLPPAYYYGFGHSPLAVKLQSRYPSYTVRSWFTIFPLLFAFLYESSEVAAKLGSDRPHSEHDKHSNLPLYQRVANLTFDHPLEALVVLAVPTVASTFHVQQLDPKLTLAERLMHTNVIAQAKLFTLMAGVLGAYRYLHFYERFEQVTK